MVPAWETPKSASSIRVAVNVEGRLVDRSSPQPDGRIRPQSPFQAGLELSPRAIDEALKLRGRALSEPLEVVELAEAEVEVVLGTGVVAVGLGRVLVAEDVVVASADQLGWRRRVATLGRLLSRRGPSQAITEDPRATRPGCQA